MDERFFPGAGPKGGIGSPCEGLQRGPRPTRDGRLFLRRSADIERVKREGRRHHTVWFSLASAASDEVHARVGIIVGRRFGSAVARNRAKRMFRALVRHSRPRLVSHRAFLVFPKRRVLDATHMELRHVWLTALRHERLLTPDPLT